MPFFHPKTTQKTNYIPFYTGCETFKVTIKCFVFVFSKTVCKLDHFGGFCDVDCVLVFKFQTSLLSQWSCIRCYWHRSGWQQGLILCCSVGVTPSRLPKRSTSIFVFCKDIKEFAFISAVLRHFRASILRSSALRMTFKCQAHGLGAAFRNILKGYTCEWKLKDLGVLPEDPQSISGFGPQQGQMTESINNSEKKQKRILMLSFQ